MFMLLRQTSSDIDEAVGDRVADLVVMDDRDDGDAPAFLLGDQRDHGRAVVGVERSGRLVEQQERHLRRGSRARY